MSWENMLLAWKKSLAVGIIMFVIGETAAITGWAPMTAYVPISVIGGLLIGHALMAARLVRKEKKG